MRETIEAIRVLGFWRVVYYRTAYRPLMRLMHRYNLHYAPPSYPQGADGYIDKVLWCQWCGMRYLIRKPTGSTVLPVASESVK